MERRMHLSRRLLLTSAAAVPAIVLVERGMRTVGDLVAGAIQAVRPAADGTSATRCALCGAGDHPSSTRAARARSG